MRFIILFTFILNSALFTQTDRGITIIAGQEYEAGTRVGLPTSGVSFIIPREWKGAMPPDQAVFVMSSNSQAGIGMAIMQTGMTRESLTDFLADPQDLGDNIILQPVGKPKRTDSRIQMDYSHTFYSGTATGILGPHGNSVTFFFAGPAAQKAYYQSLLDKLIMSVSFFEPENKNLIIEWQKLLSGMMLKRIESYSSSDYSSDSTGYHSEETLHLCANGTYSYTFDSDLAVDGEGSSDNGTDSGAKQGEWEVVVVGNQAMLLLKPHGGQQIHQSIAFDGKRFFLDGNRVYRTPSDQCQ
jgi:hypothetical protein